VWYDTIHDDTGLDAIMLLIFCDKSPKFIDIDTDASLNKDKFKSTSLEFQQHLGPDCGMFHMFGGTRAPTVQTSRTKTNVRAFATVGVTPKIFLTR
jgi:hypothetical protein